MCLLELWGVRHRSQELLQRIASYESKLTARQLRLSRISMGETSRLRRVVDKLIRGMKQQRCE